MDVENRSLYHGTATLKPVIDFVLERVPALALARLRIVDAASGYFSSGQAWKVDPAVNVFDTELVSPSLIEVRLSHHLRYPTSNTYMREVGSVRVDSFMEEFALVLGHEGHHIHQAWGFKKYTPREKEVEAERFGLETLRAYRLFIHPN